MDLILDPHMAPFLIFGLRVLNNAIGTIRVVFVSRGQKAWSFTFASMESLLFAYTAGQVITDLENVPKLVAYVLGFAVGGYVGTMIENRFYHVYDDITIISSRPVAREIAAALRDADHGVTEIQAVGARGEVTELRVIAHRRDLQNVLTIARQIKEDVFITVEQSSFIRNGWIHNHHR
jgi:uncharacterized protein YebE (UPF0316 family)